MKSTTLKRFALESVAVLAGILMAFGIDAAWEARSDAGRESAYVDALSAEVLANLLTLEEQLAALDDEFPIIAGFYESVVTSQSLVSTDDILAMLWHTGPRPLNLERAALADLLGSGGLAYLDRAELRRGIADYDRRLSDAASMRASLQRYFDVELSPYFAAHVSMPELFNRLEGVFESYEFPEDDFPVDTSAFVGNRTFANLFANYLWHLERIRDTQSGLLDSAEDLVALLAG